MRTHRWGRTTLAMTSALFVVSVLLTLPVKAAVEQGLTLNWDKPDPLTDLTSGEQISFTVGLKEELVITGYTLDVRFDDTKLDFLSSTQLVPFFGGAFIPGFNLDPAVTPGDPGSTGLASSNSGRASVLFASDSVSVAELLSLSFQVINPIEKNSLKDLLIVGILDGRADDINPRIGGGSIDLNPNIVSTVVPIPAAFWLMGSALGGLLAIGRRRRTSV